MFKLFSKTVGAPVFRGLRYNSTVKFPPNLLSLQVAKIIEIRNHENASKLYVSQVQTGTDTTIQICSGLVPFIPAENLLNSEIVILTNLKTSKMRGEKSEAMLLAASKEVDGEVKVEVVRPPSSSVIGDKLMFDGFPIATNDDEPLKNLKSKQLEEFTEFLQTNDKCQVVYMKQDGESLLRSASGNTCFVDSLQNAEVH